jgi:hypothetical protein
VGLSLVGRHPESPDRNPIAASHLAIIIVEVEKVLNALEWGTAIAHVLSLDDSIHINN